MQKLLFLISILCISSGCNSLFHPYDFTVSWMRSSSYYGTAYGLNMSKLSNFEKYAENAIRLKENTLVALALDKQTTFEADYTILLNKGGNIDISFRTISTDFVNQNKITFRLSTEGTELLENNRQVGENKAINLENKPIRIRIQNEGRSVRIFADCNMIYNYITNLPLTEYMMLQTSNNTLADISGIKFVEIPN